IVPCCCASDTACASGLSRFAEAAASIGAATLRFAAAARSTGAARSSPRSTFALTSSSDITSLFGSATTSSASISSIDTRSSSSPIASSVVNGQVSRASVPKPATRKTRPSTSIEGGGERLLGDLERAVDVVGRVGGGDVAAAEALGHLEHAALDQLAAVGAE